MLNVTFYGDTITDSAAPKKISKCHLETLKNGSGMFFGTALQSFNGDLSSLTNGNMMFSLTSLQSFDGDLRSLTNGNAMFAYCSALESFNGNLSSLEDGTQMFYNTALTSFSGDLSSLTSGYMMFYNSALASFSGDLSSLTSGYRMFYKTALASFSGDLSSLVDGDMMFYGTALTSFSGDLSSLTNGYSMFNNCSALESFNENLSSLTSGQYMFYKCKLDALSVMIIVELIRDITTEKASLTDSDYVTRTGRGITTDPYVYSKPFGWMSDGSYVYTCNVPQPYTYNPQPYTTTISSSNVGKLTIGINVTNNSSTIATQLQEFAEAANYDSWADLKQAFADKGWTVTWQYGGTSTGITLSDDEAFRGVPVWAKIEEVVPKGETYTEKEIANAEYCTEDGSKYYNISWGHDVNDEAKDETMTDESKYFYFGSLLEACGYWGVIPKQYLESNN